MWVLIVVLLIGAVVFSMNMGVFFSEDEAFVPWKEQQPPTATPQERDQTWWNTLYLELHDDPGSAQ